MFNNSKFQILLPKAESRPPLNSLEISGGTDSRFLRLRYFAAIFIFLSVFLPSAVEALTFSPPLFEFELKSGESINDRLILYNESDVTKTLYVSLENFKPGSNGISPEFVSWAGHELKNWIIVKEPNVVLKPKERHSVEFSIKAPLNATTGGHYGAILWTESPPNSGGSLAISKTGPLVLVNVAGEVEEAGELLDFAPLREFYEYLPVNFLINFKNNGVAHLKPSGEIKIKNFLGKVVAVIPINSYGGNVLPQSSRKFEAVWQKATSPEKTSVWKSDFKNLTAGRFTAELNLVYGNSSKPIEAEKSFWAIPWRVGGLGLGAILGALLIVAHGLKRYNKWLIRKYLKSLE